MHCGETDADYRIVDGLAEVFQADVRTAPIDSLGPPRQLTGSGGLRCRIDAGSIAERFHVNPHEERPHFLLHRTKPHPV